MKSKVCAGIFAFVFLVTSLHASVKQPQSNRYQQGTVLSVERQEVASYAGPDLPLRSEYYAYDVSVRVGCGIYVGHYETSFDYLPFAFSPNQLIPVRLTKYVMYFDVPGERDMEMGIVRHNDDRAAPCGANTASR